MSHVNSDFDIWQAWQEDEKQRSEARQAAKEAASRKGLYSLNTTLKDWLSWTEEEREAHKAWLQNLSNSTK